MQQSLICITIMKRTHGQLIGTYNNKKSGKTDIIATILNINCNGYNGYESSNSFLGGGNNVIINGNYILNLNNSLNIIDTYSFYFVVQNHTQNVIIIIWCMY